MDQIIWSLICWYYYLSSSFFVVIGETVATVLSIFQHSPSLRAPNPLLSCWGVNGVPHRTLGQKYLNPKVSTLQKVATSKKITNK